MKNITTLIAIDFNSKCFSKLIGLNNIIRYSKSFKQIIILERMLFTQIGVQHWDRIKGQLEDNI
jgi:hypothetical protein